MTMVHVLVDRDRNGRSNRVRIFSDAGLWARHRLYGLMSKVYTVETFVLSGTGNLQAMKLIVRRIRKARLPDLDAAAAALHGGALFGPVSRVFLRCLPETIIIMAGRGRDGSPFALTVSTHSWMAEEVKGAYLQPADDEDLAFWKEHGKGLDDDGLFAFIDRQRVKDYAYLGRTMKGAAGWLDMTTIDRAGIRTRKVREWPAPA